MPAPGAESAQMPDETVVAVMALGAGAGAGAGAADGADVAVGAGAGSDVAAVHCSGSLPWEDQGGNTYRSQHRMMCCIVHVFSSSVIAVAGGVAGIERQDSRSACKASRRQRL